MGKEALSEPGRGGPKAAALPKRSRVVITSGSWCICKMRAGANEFLPQPVWFQPGVGWESSQPIRVVRRWLRGGIGSLQPIGSGGGPRR